MLTIRLENVVPRNGRSKCSFVSSIAHVRLDSVVLRSFIECYGFLMYDREEKATALRQTSDVDAHEIAVLLTACKDTNRFRELVEEQLLQIKIMLNRTAREDKLELDNNDGVGGGGGGCNKMNNNGVSNNDAQNPLGEDSLPSTSVSSASMSAFATMLLDGDDTSAARNPSPRDYATVLRYAQRSLTEIIEFIRDTDSLEHGLRLNDFLRAFVAQGNAGSR